jgi:hypothetical protein
MDSDTVIVEGFSVVGGFWRACLVREAMRGYCEDEGDFSAYLPAGAAAAAAAGWAVEAGLVPDRVELEAVFAVEEVDLFAEELFFTMLRCLGLGQSP